MSEFRVRYMIEGIYHQGENSFTKNTSHSLIVEAPDRVNAFLVVYDHLTRQGHHVSTWSFGNHFARGEGESNPLGFSDDEVEAIRKSGVAFDRSYTNGAHIEDISSYEVRYNGSIKGAENSAA